MMYGNAYYIALMEGRYQPRIDVKEDASGSYEAVYEDAMGHRIAASHEDRNEAFRRCNDKVVEGIKAGDLHPFR